MHKIETEIKRGNKQKSSKLNTRAYTYEEVEDSYRQSITDNSERKDKKQKGHLPLIKHDHKEPLFHKEKSISYAWDTSHPMMWQIPAIHAV